VGNGEERGRVGVLFQMGVGWAGPGRLRDFGQVWLLMSEAIHRDASKTL